MKELLGPTINRFLRACGYEVRRYDFSNTAFQARQAIMDSHLDTVIDVGANRGQYGGGVACLRPDVAIHSFEPLPDAFSDLQAASRDIDRWRVHNVALGRASAEMVMHVAANSESSSLLSMNQFLIDTAPETAPVNTVKVAVKPLDDFIRLFGRDIFLKVDAQGFEAEVIGGGAAVLKRTRFVQLEVSFVQLYDNSPLAHDIIKQMFDIGFEVHTVNPVFSDSRRARLLQGDILFSRPMG